jgi:hypothetical protein
LGFGAKIILGITILIFYAGIQGGLIGSLVGGIIAYGFYYIAIRQLAKYKKLDLMVEKPPLTTKEIAKKENASKSRSKFWIIFLSVCGGILILTFLFVRFVLY